MIAASAMLFLAQAVTPCTTAGTPRLGGGAVLLRPVTSFQAVPFVQLGPATSIRSKRHNIQQTGAAGETPEQCQAVLSHA